MHLMDVGGDVTGKMIVPIVETGPGHVPVHAFRAGDDTVERVQVTVAVPNLDPAASGVHVEQAATVLDLPVTVDVQMAAFAQQVLAAAAQLVSQHEGLQQLLQPPFMI